jgi:hypothetical protein
MRERVMVTSAATASSPKEIEITLLFATKLRNIFNSPFKTSFEPSGNRE